MDPMQNFCVFIEKPAWQACCMVPRSTQKILSVYISNEATGLSKTGRSVFSPGLRHKGPPNANGTVPCAVIVPARVGLGLLERSAHHGV